MRSVEVMNSATTSEVPACPAARSESVAHVIRCVALGRAAVMASIYILFERIIDMCHLWKLFGGDHTLVYFLRIILSCIKDCANGS